MPSVSRSCRRLLLALPLAGVTAVSLEGCFFKSTTVSSIAARDSVSVVSSVKAHLLDGETVIFPRGIRIVDDTVHGSGQRYDLLNAARPGSLVDEAVPLDSVAAMESFTTKINVASSVIVLTFVAAAAAGVALLAAASFGSCPTVYSDSAGTPRLEAEGFPYSISPLLEQRDLHRLRARPESTGVLSLEIRNEALETHYINQLELLRVTHAPDEYVLPDAENQPLAVRHIVRPSRARDRAGHDVSRALSGNAAPFRSDPRTIESVTAADLDDWINLSFPAPRGADSVALLFDLRNSLLNTVLLYDQMLAPQGARALDFEAHDLNDISRMVAIGRWYSSRMGMRVSVRRNGAWEDVARVADSGPIAWHQTAVEIPVPKGDTLRVRLSFVADEWRIRRVRLAASFRHPRAERMPLVSLLVANGVSDSSALAGVREVDARYLETTPGQWFTVRFAAGGGSRYAEQSYLLAMDGYYTEWIRGNWIKRPGSRPFVASDSTMAATVHRWARVQPSFEREFDATRIPVR